MLYSALCVVFSTVVVISNLISVKMVPLPFDFAIPAGLFLYPLTFFISDLTTELFGAKKSTQMVYIGLGASLASWGVLALLPTGTLLSLGGLRIFSSLIAYLSAQIAGISLYASLKRITGPRFLWLRNNVSMWGSQIIDTVMIDFLFLYWGLGWSWPSVLPVMLFSFAYKATFSLVSTPLLYWTRSLFTSPRFHRS